MLIIVHQALLNGRQGLNTYNWLQKKEAFAAEKKDINSLKKELENGNLRTQKKAKYQTKQVQLISLYEAYIQTLDQEQQKVKREIEMPPKVFFI